MTLHRASGLFMAVLLASSTAQAQGVLRVDGATDVSLFGRNIMPLGDCDGDGVPDYGVEGADSIGDGLINNRTLRVLSGGTGALIWANPLLSDSRSASADSIGDINGDGLDDVVYAYPTGLANKACIVDGGTGALIRELPFLAVRFVDRVQAIRDLDGDGALDVLVQSRSGNASPIFQLYSSATGSRLNGQFAIPTWDAFMVAAPTPGQSKIITRDFTTLRRFNYPQVAVLDLEVPGPDDQTLSIDPLDDVNGDGWEDVLCRSVALNPTGGYAAYRVSVLSGETLQPIWDEFFPLGAASQAIPNIRPVAVGDQNGDGVSDVGLGMIFGNSAIPDRELVEIRSGVDGALLRGIESFDFQGYWGAQLAPVGDIDGDGVSELGVWSAYSALPPSGFGSTSQVYILRSMESPTGMQGLEFCRIGPENSTGVIAGVSATGSANVPAGNMTLHATDLPAGAFGIFLASASPQRLPSATGGGLCLGGPIGRYAAPGQILQADASGRASLVIDASQIPLSTTFGTPLAGEVYGFQMWHRDTDMSGAATSRFTAGVSITFR